MQCAKYMHPFKNGFDITAMRRQSVGNTVYRENVSKDANYQLGDLFSCVELVPLFSLVRSMSMLQVPKETQFIKAFIFLSSRRMRQWTVSEWGDLHHGFRWVSLPVPCWVRRTDVCRW